MDRLSIITHIWHNTLEFHEETQISALDISQAH